MPYVDGFVVPVPRKNLAAYRRLAQTVGRVWRDHGALEFREWIGDDVPKGKRTSFPRSVKLKRGEVVILAWAVYKSRAHRDRVMKRSMADRRLAAIMKAKAMPFDTRRMFFGGFRHFVAL